ncbi:MAG: ankyrin repeat domain-containing protein [Spirochaetia bacterium]
MTFHFPFIDSQDDRISVRRRKGESSPSMDMGKFGETLAISLAITWLLAAAVSNAENVFELAKSGTPEQVQAALDAGQGFNERGRNGMTPLMQAALFNPNPEVVELLVKAGARLDDATSDGRTAVLLAAQFNQNPAVVSALLRAAGATENNASSALTFAAESNPNPAVIAALLQAGARIDTTLPDGRTPLMLAAEFNQNPEIIVFLLQAGANKALKSAEGKTAYDYGAENTNVSGTRSYFELKDPAH